MARASRSGESKTDQEGAGRVVAIPYGSNPQLCPVRTIRAWLAAAQITDGPLFRSVDRHGHVGSPRANRAVVRQVVQRYCRAAGLDAKLFGAHSLRAGMATQARPPSTAPPKAPSCARPATSPSPWSAATSAIRNYGGITRPPGWVYKTADFPASSGQASNTASV